MKQKLLAPLFAIVCVFSSFSYADQWQYKIEPYLMLTSIDGDSSIGTVDAPLAVDFDTILNNLDAPLCSALKLFINPIGESWLTGRIWI